MLTRSVRPPPPARRADPYGNPLGAEAASPWPDTHGFLNKPTNTTTGLTDIGARNYDPAIGAFISVDPILDMANPQSWTGYAYAGNNPTTFSDPTGLYQECGPGCGIEGSGWETKPAKYQEISD